jgi:hypothetical protein
MSHAVCAVSDRSPVIVTHDGRFEMFVTKYHKRFTVKHEELRLSKEQMKTIITFCVTQRQRTRTGEIDWPFVTKKFGFEKRVIRNMVRAWSDKMKNKRIVTDGTVSTFSTVSTVSDVDAHPLADVPDVANPLLNPLDSLLDILPLVYPPISYEELQISDEPPLSTFV